MSYEKCIPHAFAIYLFPIFHSNRNPQFESQLMLEGKPPRRRLRRAPIRHYIINMFSLSSVTRRVLNGAGNVLSRVQRPSTQHHVETALSPLSMFTRGRGQLAPKKVKWLRRHKGRVPIPIGGSTKGTTLAFGEWGIRIKGNGARLSAKQLTTAQEVIQKKLKVLKGAKVYLRVFPDLPVCVKVSMGGLGE